MVTEFLYKYIRRLLMINVDKTKAPIKSKEDILKLKYANQISSAILQELGPYIQPGITVTE